MTPLHELEAGLKIVEFNHSGSSNFIVWLLDENGSEVDLLVNEIGPYSGSGALSISKSGKYVFDVYADGDWTLNIVSPTSSPDKVPLYLGDSGQKVTQLYELKAGLSIMEFDHSGSSNFFIWLLDENGSQVDLLVNEIGPYSGSGALSISRTGEYLFDVYADGAWTLNIVSSGTGVSATPVPTPVLSGQSFPSFLDNFSHLDGSSYLMAQDGEYIGEISSNQFDSESICNDFGKFGSEFSNTSIRNEFGPYGSEFRTYSAYNPFTSSPPLILFNDYGDGIHLGYLTKNDFLYESLDPDLLLLSLGCLD